MRKKQISDYGLTWKILPLLYLPVFFLSDGSIFYLQKLQYDYSSHGQIEKLPLPVSIVIMLAGLLLTFRYRRQRACLIFTIALLIIVTLNYLISVFMHHDVLTVKAIKSIQFLLPLPALILGQNIEQNLKKKQLFRLDVIGFCFISIIVLIQLIQTYLSPHSLLSPQVLYFSVYQHFQYVPTVIVTLFVYFLFSLSTTGCARFSVVMIPVIGAYALLSLSRSACLIYFLGTFCFMLSQYKIQNLKYMVMLATMILLPLMLINLPLVTYFEYNNAGKQSYVADEFYLSRGFNDVLISDTVHYGRLSIYNAYLGHVFQSPRQFFIGTGNDELGQIYGSAHNYYLQGVYFFGATILLPYAFLMYVTFRKIALNPSELIQSMTKLGLLIGVFYLVIVDNSFKTGMMQPYPGIISFFLWGRLIGSFDKEIS